MRSKARTEHNNNDIAFLAGSFNDKLRSRRIKFYHLIKQGDENKTKNWDFNGRIAIMNRFSLWNGILENKRLIEGGIVTQVPYLKSTLTANASERCNVPIHLFERTLKRLIVSIVNNNFFTRLRKSRRSLLR